MGRAARRHRRSGAAELGGYAAPNVPGSVLARQVLVPPDLEARVCLTGGHIFHGELVPYLCGSGA